MNSVTSRRLVAGMLITGVMWNSAVWAQYTNYSDYYRAQKSAYPGKAIGPNRYLYDKYFHHRATVSPYLSGAVLGGSDAGTAYTTSIRPEIQRREAAARTQANYIQQRKLQGNIGYTAHPGAGFYGGTLADAYHKPVQATRTTPSFYHNHWYGGWNKR